MPTNRPTRRLSKAPLVYTLAQVKFTPFAGMKNVVADIQDVLRKDGYPRFHNVRTQRMHLGPQGPKASELEHWEFGTADNRSLMLLTEDMIVFQTTRYTTFSDFATKLKPLLDAVNTHAKLESGLIQRIGIRYTDIIKLKEKETFSDFLTEGLVGPFSKNGNESRLFLESQRATDEGTLAIRCIRDNSGMIVPPDLEPLKIEIPSNKKTSAGEWAMILDFDHFSEEERTGFNSAEVISVIDSLHKVANDEFFNSITDKAKKEWE